MMDLSKGIKRIATIEVGYMEKEDRYGKLKYIPVAKVNEEFVAIAKGDGEVYEFKYESYALIQAVEFARNKIKAQEECEIIEVCENIKIKE